MSSMKIMLRRNHKSLFYVPSVALVLAFLCSPLCAQQPGTSASQTFTPAPSANAPAQQGTQSASPQQQQQQPAPQTPPPSTPSAPFSGSLVGAPSSQPQGGTVQATQGQQPSVSPGSQIPSPAGARLPGRESVPTVAPPQDVALPVPVIAPDFRASAGRFHF